MAQKQSGNQRVPKSKNSITGIINVVGEPDSGKTWFAMSSGAAPERTAFIDDDVKGNAMVSIIEAEGRSFGMYRNLMRETKGMRELQLHDHCMEIINEIDQRAGEFDVLVWDTWKRFEDTFHPVIVKNPSKYKEFYSSMGQIKGAEQWNASFELESATLAVLQDTVPLIFLVSHLKNDAQKRQVAEAKKPLIQKSRMRVFLRHTPGSPIPTGLMLKRLSRVDFAKGMEPINVTHRKVKELTWKKLLHYWENPVGNTPPGPEEMLDEYELSVLDGILTKDQRMALELELAQLKAEQAAEEKQRKLMRQMAQAPEPEVPEEPFGLMSKAVAEYDIDMEKLAEILGIEEDEVLQITDVQKAWETVKAYAEGKKTKQVSNNSKRRGR